MFKSAEKCTHKIYPKMTARAPTLTLAEKDAMIERVLVKAARHCNERTLATTIEETYLIRYRVVASEQIGPFEFTATVVYRRLRETVRLLIRRTNESFDEEVNENLASHVAIVITAVADEITDETVQIATLVNDSLYLIINPAEADVDEDDLEIPDALDDIAAMMDDEHPIQTLALEAVYPITAEPTDRQKVEYGDRIDELHQQALSVINDNNSPLHCVAFATLVLGRLVDLIIDVDDDGELLPPLAAAFRHVSTIPGLDAFTEEDGMDSAYDVARSSLHILQITILANLLQ